MLDFAHGSNDERNLYDVTAIVQDVVSMVKHLGEFHDRRITINRTTPCEAWINGQEIKQVILNLVANAPGDGARGRSRSRSTSIPSRSRSMSSTTAAG